MSIFVSIPSYRDPECAPTVRSLFERAAEPNRVFVGICWQRRAGQDSRADCFDGPSQHSHQVRVLEMDSALATGPCLARHLAQSLYRGERFHLQIDSHSRFADGWDTLLVDAWQQARSVSPKPVVTAYPPGYDRDQKSQSAQTSDCSSTVVVTCASHFDSDDGMLRLVGKQAVRPPSDSPLPALFWVAGFAFSEASVLHEVPYDPHLPMLFFGEEPSMAARLWTHGYDFFTPVGAAAVFHHWSRDYRPSFRENDRPVRYSSPTGTSVQDGQDHGQQSVIFSGERHIGSTNGRSDEELVSMGKVHALLGAVSALSDENGERVSQQQQRGPYGLGSKRSLAEYEKFIGVSFSLKQIVDRDLATFGGRPPVSFVNELIASLVLGDQKS